MKSNKILSLLIAMALGTALIGCAAVQVPVKVPEQAPAETTEPIAEDITEEIVEEPVALDDVTIVYTNDSHTYINNILTDDEGNESKGLTFSKVAAYANSKRAAGKNVLLVDAGDHVQGTAFGGMDEGSSIIQIMNAAGYDVATIGNHEFDYGQFRFFKLLEEANFPYLSCNFYNVGDQSLVLPAYQIFEEGNTKVAIIGISTPETYTKSAPTYFQDENGEFIYGFFSGTDGKELYDSVQKTIDEVKDKADYVIGLAHLGVDPSSVPYTSRELIANTTGLDAIIDGHSHTTVDREEVLDAEGNTVILTQTGCNLNAFGEMKLSGGEISCELITEYDEEDTQTAAIENEWIASVNDKLGQKIAVSDVDLYISDADDPETRLIRRKETNLGDICSDAIYWYLNEMEVLNCDVAIANGGGIRCDVAAGDLTYLTAKGVHPFGNVICIVNVTGQQLKDALEMGARYVGLSDPESGAPAECGAFLHVAGMKYTIDSTIESTLGLTEEGVYESAPLGEYKVSDIEIYNRETREYEPIDLNKTYSLGGINYTLRNCGDGMAMFDDAEPQLDFIIEDYLCLSEYLRAFSGVDTDGLPHVSTENSPLNILEYKDYLMDYENPLGSGRITIK